jgi:hypothetical protein
MLIAQIASAAPEAATSVADAAHATASVRCTVGRGCCLSQESSPRHSTSIDVYGTLSGDLTQAAKASIQSTTAATIRST